MTMRLALPDPVAGWWIRGLAIAAFIACAAYPRPLARRGTRAGASDHAAVGSPSVAR
jgi:hypothetical protein